MKSFYPYLCTEWEKGERDQELKNGGMPLYLKLFERFLICILLASLFYGAYHLESLHRSWLKNDEGSIAKQVFKLPLRPNFSVPEFHE